jgi:hypothetical protein
MDLIKLMHSDAPSRSSCILCIVWAYLFMTCLKQVDKVVFFTQQHRKTRRRRHLRRWGEYVKVQGCKICFRLWLVFLEISRLIKKFHAPPTQFRVRRAKSDESDAQKASFLMAAFILLILAHLAREWRQKAHRVILLFL